MSYDEWNKHWEWMKEREIVHEGTSGWIQWKGTDVCMDIHCECGTHSHVDEEFFYYFQCDNCKKIYSVCPNIQFIELDKENEEFVRRDREDMIKTDLNWDDE